MTDQPLPTLLERWRALAEENRVLAADCLLGNERLRELAEKCDLHADLIEWETRGGGSS